MDDLERQAQKAAADGARARERYEQARADLMRHIGVATDDTGMRMQLDHLFELGHLAGSSGENALAIKEVFQDYKGVFDRSDKRTDERDRRGVEEHNEHMKLLQALVAAVESQRDQMERLADSVEEFTDEYEDDGDDDGAAAEPPRPQPPRRPR